MILALIYGRRGWEWHEVIMGLLAFMLAYADIAAAKISGIQGRQPGLGHLLVVVGAALGGLVVFTSVMLPRYPEMEWWTPVLFVAVMLALRAVHHFLVSLFDFTR